MQNALRFLMKKKSFASLTNNFWSFKKQIKKYLSMEQNLCFFSSEIWGHCIYFLQVLISEYEGIYNLQVLPSNSILPSDLEGKNSIFFRRSFFPRYALGMPSFNNSVFGIKLTPFPTTLSSWFDFCKFLNSSICMINRSLQI